MNHENQKRKNIKKERVKNKIIRTRILLIVILKNKMSAINTAKRKEKKEGINKNYYNCYNIKNMH